MLMKMNDFKIPASKMIQSSQPLTTGVFVESIETKMYQ